MQLVRLANCPRSCSLTSGGLLLSIYSLPARQGFQIVLLIQVSHLININHSCSILTFLRWYLNYNNKTMVMWSPAWIRTKDAFGDKAPLKVFSAGFYLQFPLEHTHQRSGNRFLRFLWAQFFHGIIVLLLFFCHENILTSKVKGQKENWLQSAHTPEGKGITS